MAKSWLVGFGVDGPTRLKLEISGEDEEYYRSFPEEDLPDEVVEMLRTFHYASRDRDGRCFVYGPRVIGEFDHHPVSDEELFEKILAGCIGIHRESPGTLKEVAERFLRRKATFTELRMAVGHTK